MKKRDLFIIVYCIIIVLSVMYATQPLQPLLAKEFDIKTVAEFVANEHIYNKVKELNIDYSQGYFFDKPLKYEDIV